MLTSLGMSTLFLRTLQSLFVDIITAVYRYAKAHAVIIELPLEGKGIINVDGEVLPTQTTFIDVLPSLATIYVGAEMDLPYRTDLPQEGLNCSGHAIEHTEPQGTCSFQPPPT
jgi:hypothetical protein